MPYLTPDWPPPETTCYTLKVPNDAKWTSIVKGALSELIRSFRFEQFGTATPEQTASRFLEMYDEFVFSECEGGMDCCTTPILHRINPETGRMEISVDSGEHWTPDPDDPALLVMSLPPPVPAGVSETKCDAATNAWEHIKDVIAHDSETLGAGGSVFEIGVAIAVFIIGVIISGGTALALAGLLLGVVGSLVALGRTAFDAYWTSTEEDKILCILFDHIGDDGSFDDSGYDAVVGDIETVLTAGIPRNMLLTELKAMGKAGLNNLAAYGVAADANCAGCECDISAWGILTNGTEISRDEVSITISATVGGGGQYFIDLSSHVAGFDPSTPYDTNCCKWDYEITVGSVAVNNYVPCGSNYTSGLVGIADPPHVDDGWLIELKDVNPFTVVFTLH